MDQPGVISGYLAELSARLPGPIVEEVADGLDQTYRRYRAGGLAEHAAARAALREFGEPHVIAAAFACANPVRHRARRLLVAGPLVGACWGVALITSRAWAWPVPLPVRIGFGALLITVIALLGFAAFSGHYRRAGRAGTTACTGLIGLDLAMLTAAILAAPAPTGPILFAMTASAARISLTAGSLRHVVAG